MKKLMLLALVAPKALDVLRTNPAGDLLPLLKLLPLLGGAKLDKLLPIALLAMAAFDAPEVAALLKSVVSKKLVSGGYGVRRRQWKRLTRKCRWWTIWLTPGRSRTDSSKTK
ncbi:hypothetical protein BESB_086070 [Besnoitia besnoiti]|uniref:Uncharacterized protein n=1 Tax=Besnoitia besnoiti TaxID=94643 RepID=A0A2A9LWB9_BESBE|nr:uncharacterized protein BESB_086070 [Besnoitia besnoiti]PFH30778.1 hypothetical protein BESB_086070 [Besnoitia besnoiti]